MFSGLLAVWTQLLKQRMAGSSALHFPPLRAAHTKGFPVVAQMQSALKATPTAHPQRECGIDCHTAPWIGGDIFGTNCRHNDDRKGALRGLRPTAGVGLPHPSAGSCSHRPCPLLLSGSVRVHPFQRSHDHEHSAADHRIVHSSASPLRVLRASVVSHSPQQSRTHIDASGFVLRDSAGGKSPLHQLLLQIFQPLLAPRCVQVHPIIGISVWQAAGLVRHGGGHIQIGAGLLLRKGAK